MSKTVKIVIAAIFTIVAVAIVGSLASAKPDVDVANYNSSDTPAASAPASTTAAPVKEAPKLTEDQENAIGKAQDYLNFLPFSKVGLARQMAQFDHFTLKDAQFAVNHIKVDWKEQAVKKAQSYLAFTHFSRSGMIAQLKYDKFTDAEAKYGTDKAFDSAE